MINGTAMLGKGNPRCWLSGNATDGLRTKDNGPPVQRGPDLPAGGIGLSPAAVVTSAFRVVTAAGRACLTDLPRRVGDRLFAANDAEARWRGWQITRLADGLARQYRDSRFGSLPDRPGPHGRRVAPDTRRDLIPRVPEAWDGHWNYISPGDGDR